jgi:hypothetical protein
MWFQNLIGKIKRLIAPERRARASHAVQLSSIPSQHERRAPSALLEWCRAFNRRNGWRVPARSARSIYLATRGKARS